MNTILIVGIISIIVLIVLIIVISSLLKVSSNCSRAEEEKAKERLMSLEEIEMTALKEIEEEKEPLGSSKTIDELLKENKRIIEENKRIIKETEELLKKYSALKEKQRILTKKLIKNKKDKR